MTRYLPRRRAAASLFLLALWAGSARAQTPPPSPEQVLGYGLGERFTPAEEAVRYLEGLAAASPRVQIQRYGASSEGRPLVQVVIAREDRLASLDRVLARNRELADPSTSEARVREIAADNPVIVYFQYGVHGNESSSTEAALWTAWDLARGAPAVAGVLDSAIVVIDPVVNPDGRNRYVSWYRQARGLEPDPDRNAREHWESWPGGRFNHYLFDLNRDWAAMTQPETRQRIATWSRWMPQVDVDFHEMSPNSSYFFPPETAPINPIYPEWRSQWTRYFGRANAAAFDARGWPYFTRESYDMFAPIYGDSWPSLVGAIGMTYEQAGGGSAGLAYRRLDGLILTLHDRALHHWTTGEATARAAAARRSELLLAFARFHRVENGPAEVLLAPGADTTRARALVSLLRDQGIRVERAGRAFSAPARPYPAYPARREFPAGSYLVRAGQPRGRLAVALLQPEALLKADYSYDISAWSLPYAYGVAAYRVDRVPDAQWQALPPTDPSLTLGPLVAVPVPDSARQFADAPAEPYGYLVRPEVAAWPALVAYLRSGGRAVVLRKPFTAADRTWPAGTVFLPRNGVTGLSARVRAAGLEALSTQVRSGLTTEGVDLGTEESTPVKLPRVALLAGEGTSPTSFGAHWFFLERMLGIPFDAVPLERVARVDLGDYDVVVVPDVGEGMERSRIEALKRWVEQGGTLVAVADAARALAEPLAGIRVRLGARADSAQGDTARALRGREARELERWQEEVPGTILAARLDPAHPLAFGAGADGDPTRLFVLKSGTLAFTPDASFESVAFFDSPPQKVSGVISGRNLDRLAHSAWLVTRSVGKGHAILFADDPLFRDSFYGMFQPYVNSLLLGPTL